MKNCIEIFKKNDKAKIPQKATACSAGWDLFACLDHELTLFSGDTFLVPTGVAAALPSSDYVGLIFARSGLGAKFGVSLPNGVGVIDSDYRGEIFVSLKNFGKNNYVISPGDRIAQLVVLPICNFPLVEVSSLSNTERGESGFGSTGK
ncbi:MAG: dUTP diphosphatase [Oscillospiraceae bacterium]|jgi:dUTP pyrophosphatase|nr:dUTP diphosphatase [Oscillospiraceae bacterium]